MRIAYVINSVEGGGAALPVPAVGRTLSNLGATVEVFALTRRDGRAAAPMQGSGLTVNVRDGGERDHRQAYLWLNRQFDRFRPQVIWTSLTRATLLGQLVGARRRLPVVSWQHNAYLKPANQLLLTATQRLSALWIGDSESVTILTAERLGVPEKRLETWPLFAADPAAPRARPWMPGQTVQIGSLGRLHPAKGYDLLIEAFARMQTNGFSPPAPVQVEIGGEGAERQRLEGAIAGAGLTNIALVGFVERPHDFLAARHLYVQPSRREGLCIAAHEAMQAGLPIIASSVGEMPHTVQPGFSGMIAPPGDVDALAKALVALLSRPGDLAIMGQVARARVLDRFSGEAFAKAGATIFERLTPLAAK